MPFKNKANDEFRAEDLPALDSVTEAAAANSSRATATAAAPANESDNEVAKIEQLLTEASNQKTKLLLRKTLRGVDLNRLSDDLFDKCLQELGSSNSKKAKTRKTRVKHLQQIVNPPPDDFKDKDADWLIKNATREQLVACFVEKHGHFPDPNDTKEKLAKAIIVASGRDFYLHLTEDEIKAEIVNEIGFRYNYKPTKKTLVEQVVGNSQQTSF